MEKKEILEAIQQLKKDSPKRNFSQSYDFLVKLQHFDPKKNENKVDVFVALPYFLGRKQKKTSRLAIKNNEMAVRCPIGKDTMKDEEIAENILTAYTLLVQALPQHEQNVKFILLKLTMSKAVAIGGKK